MEPETFSIMEEDLNANQTGNQDAIHNHLNAIDANNANKFNNALVLITIQLNSIIESIHKD